MASCCPTQAALRTTYRLLNGLLYFKKDFFSSTTSRSAADVCLLRRELPFLKACRTKTLMENFLEMRLERADMA